MAEHADPAPMLDVHAPHQSVHTWKDFFIHIATIVVGLLIAIGLEQTVEHFHHKHQVAEVRDSLNVERRFNANRFGVLTYEFRRFVPKLETNLAVFTYLRGHPNAPVADWPGKLDWLALNLGDDVYGILHATTNADDQKAINALMERIDQMERELRTRPSIGEPNQTATESGKQ